MRTAIGASKGEAEQETASVAAGGGVAYLRVMVTQGGKCHFGVIADNEEFTPIGQESVARPGVWVGAKVGLFAMSAGPTAARGHADWAWFHVDALPSGTPSTQVSRDGRPTAAPGRRSAGTVPRLSPPRRGPGAG